MEMRRVDVPARVSARLVHTIKIKIKTFANLVLILRLVSRLLKPSLDIETGIETFENQVETCIKTFRISVLISRLVLRLSKLQF